MTHCQIGLGPRLGDRSVLELGGEAPGHLVCLALSGGIPANPCVDDATRGIEAHLNGRGQVIIRPSGTEPVVRWNDFGSRPEDLLVL